MPAPLDCPAYAIVADPASLRWQYYHRDLLAFWRERNQQPQIELLHWRDVIERRGRLEGLITATRPSLLRIESPARDPQLLEQLARASDACSDGEPEYREATQDLTGRILSPQAVYAGLCCVLDGLAQSLGRSKTLRPTANVSDIAILFDKNRTTERLAAAGIPTPLSFRPRGLPGDLLAELRKRKWKRAFIKLAHGSCASGLAVVEGCSGEPSAITTMIEIGGHYHNTFRLQRLAGSDLSRALAFLIREGATAQVEIPKPLLGGQNFDLRVVVVRGQVAATIFRVSSHAMTNLHLGGWRGDPEACRRLIPQRQWLDGLDCCVAAASLFDVPAIGVDLVFQRHSYQPYILELNAFGDFVRDWKDDQGRTIYQREIESTARFFAPICSNTPLDSPASNP